MADDARREPSAVVSDHRYARHLTLPEVGAAGQRRLAGARVLIVGAGGLGSPAALYLAAAGVGTLGIADDDTVDESNLQRQVLHGTPDVGRLKVDSAHDRLRALNPDVRVERHPVRVTAASAESLVRQYDVVLDGSDNFATRYAVSDACVRIGRPDVHGSVSRFAGQLSVFAVEGAPCYRCLFPEPPPAGSVPDCAEAGVLGVLPGLIGTLQATEALKLILGIGEPLAGRLLLVEALRMEFTTIAVAPDPACVACAGGSARRPAVMPADQGVEEIAPGELAALLRDGADVQVIDVREPDEWATGCIAGAELVPLARLDARLPQLDRSRRIVTVCERGTRSAIAAAQLSASGAATVSTLVGGMERWRRLGLPVARR